MEITVICEKDGLTMKLKGIRRYDGIVKILMECKKCGNLVTVIANKNITLNGVSAI